jgi:hypothetical protein
MIYNVNHARFQTQMAMMQALLAGAVVSFAVRV